MEQLTRRFIRLSEIPEKTSATQGDVMAAIEDNQLTLFAYVEAKCLGAYGTRDNHKVVYAVFDYQGMVQLKSKDAARIIRLMKPTEISVLLVMEPERITGWSSVDDVFPNIQKTNLHYTKQCPELPTTPISAIAELSSTPTVENVVSKFASAFLNPKEDEKHTKLQDALLNLNINDSTAQAVRLNAKPVLINPEQLRVEVEGINRWLIAIQPAITVEPVKKSSSRLHEVALSHPIEKIAYRVLEIYGDQDAPKVWELIKKDSLEEVKKQFDIDGYIIEVMKDSILWLDNKGTENSLGYQSFRKKHLPLVRKAIRENSD
ncbi:hypothetical protein OTK59_04920 [Vibrio natriegens]|uniref:hypothetical protein n=1 Tax=Vibrio natriegens TaxID=691 RepID=UPI0022843132|nr:hypothetical protein [Vibrio natriegens]MCY9875892.1 hypothetical protein [Vibrio natriegens]